MKGENMNEEIAGKLIAFKNNGEGDKYAQGSVLVEVTNFEQTGDMEIAFTAPVPGNPRMYLKFSLPEILQSAMNKHVAKR
jgi:hypothetical protein